MKIIRGYLIFALGIVLIFGGLSTTLVNMGSSPLFSRDFIAIGIISTFAGIYILYWTRKNSLSVKKVIALLESNGFKTEEEIRRISGVFFGSWPESKIGKMDGILVDVSSWWMMRNWDWSSKIKIYLTVPIKERKRGVVDINGSEVGIPETFEEHTDKQDLELFKKLAMEFRDVRARFVYNQKFLWMIMDIEAVEGKNALNSIHASVDAFLKLSKTFNADLGIYRKIEGEMKVIDGDATTKSSYKELELIKNLEKIESRRHIAGIMIGIFWLVMAYVSYLIGSGTLKYVVILGCIVLAAFFTISGFKFWRLEGRRALEKWSKL